MTILWNGPPKWYFAITAIDILVESYWQYRRHMFYIEWWTYFSLRSTAMNIWSLPANKASESSASIYNAKMVIIVLLPHEYIWIRTWIYINGSSDQSTFLFNSETLLTTCFYDLNAQISKRRLKWWRKLIYEWCHLSKSEESWEVRGGAHQQTDKHHTLGKHNRYFSLYPTAGSLCMNLAYRPKKGRKVGCTQSALTKF